MGRVFCFAQRVTFCVGTLLMLMGTLCAQDMPANPALSTPQFGIPEDWSTQHVIYTRNGSIEQMMAVRGDPRFLNSFLVHSMREHGNAIQPANPGLNNNSNKDELIDNSSDDDTKVLQAQNPGNEPLRRPTPPRRNKRSKVDWAVSLGPSFGMAIGESPAKYSFNPNAAPTCTTIIPPVVGDFIVFSLKAHPTVGSQANLVGVTNLYSGTSPTGLCGTAPTFLFSYAIGSGGSLLSPVLSLDGKKVAWIENTTANHAVLHVTTWVLGQGTNATSGSVAIGSGSSDVAIDYTSSAYSGCAASTNINTNSEIYVDYATDNAFVGADNGILYHLKGIFKGTPTFDFCIVVNNTAGTALSGGVYDPLLATPEFFIADSKKLYAYTVGPASFTLKTTVTYGAGTLTGPGPVLDAFNNFIYVFSAKDTAAISHTSVTQLPTSLASAVTVPLGPASTNNYPILFYGTFDNNYFTNGPKGAKSTLYSCGTDPTTTTAQDLYAIGFIAATGVMNTTPVMPANKNVNPPNGTANGTCSPITEFYDGTTDRIFVGMGQHSANSGANIVQMWNVTTQLTSANTTPTASASPYVGGPSGLVIDNNANATPQAESVYFSTLVCAGANACGANNCCAVKLTQSLLK